MQKIFLTLLIYIVGYFGLTSIWDQAKHIGHVDWAANSAPEIVYIGIFVPVLLGIASAMVLRPQTLAQYWPIAIAPGLLLGLRTLFDDVYVGWLSENWSGLVFGVIITAAISIIAAFLFQRTSAG